MSSISLNDRRQSCAHFGGIGGGIAPADEGAHPLKRVLYPFDYRGGIIRDTRAGRLADLRHFRRFDDVDDRRGESRGAAGARL